MLTARDTESGALQIDPDAGWALARSMGIVHHAMNDIIIKASAQSEVLGPALNTVMKFFLPPGTAPDLDAVLERLEKIAPESFASERSTRDGLLVCPLAGVERAAMPFAESVLNLISTLAQLSMARCCAGRNSPYVTRALGDVGCVTRALAELSPEVRDGLRLVDAGHEVGSEEFWRERFASRAYIREVSGRFLRWSESNSGAWRIQLPGAPKGMNFHDEIRKSVLVIMHLNLGSAAAARARGCRVFGGECPICLEALDLDDETQEINLWGCGHGSHLRCYMEAENIEIMANCPHCRHDWREHGFGGAS